MLATAPCMARKSSNPTHIAKCLPRMSWSAANLYNVFQRAYGPPTADTKFTKSSLTMFQQKWKAKQLVRAYHGDWIPETKFKRHYLPDGLPPIVADTTASARVPSTSSSRAGRDRDAAVPSNKVPLASMMFAELEKRLDTVVFRCCFADSVYRARMMVVHGKVKLNGRKVTDPNTRLNPGDLISVDPRAVTTLQPPRPQEGVTAAANESSSAAIPAAVPTDAGSEAGESSEQSSEAGAASTSSSIPPPPPPKEAPPLPFHLPEFASPFLFIPPYIEPSFQTCSAIYLRHPTAKAGVSEVPSPYEADGEVMRLAWEYYVAQGRKGDARPARMVGKRLGA